MVIYRYHRERGESSDTGSGVRMMLATVEITWESIEEASKSLRLTLVERVRTGIFSSPLLLLMILLTLLSPTTTTHFFM